MAKAKTRATGLPVALERLDRIVKRLEPLVPRLDELVLWETASACAVLRSDDRAS